MRNGGLRIAFLTILIALAIAGPARAVLPDEVLDDPALEARARALSAEFRCMVCQNQSIDDSDAGLARDLRVLVRERIKAGDSNQQVIDFVVARYGDFVLLKPPVKSSTLVLWAGPAAVALFGMLALVLYFRRRRTAPAAAAKPLSVEEQARLKKLLEGDSA